MTTTPTPGTGRPAATVAGNGLALDLAERLCALRYEDVPASVVTQAKYHLVHHLGLALSGHALPLGRSGAQLARELGPGGSTTVVGEAQGAAPLDAVLANSAMMRAAGLDDVLFPAGVHAGIVTIPVAMALGEQHAGTGRDLLLAVVASYEAMAALADGLWAWSAETPRRPTMAFGTFGSAVAAARMLQLDPARTAQALGYAAFSAMGLAEGDPLMHYYGLVARNGHLGALLAAAGGEATPWVLEGRFGFYRTFFGHVPEGIDEAVAAVGQRFGFTDAITKRYPGTGLNIVAIEVMLDLVRRHGLQASDVESIEVAIPPERENFAAGHAPPPYATPADASSSVRFQVSIVLLDGRVDVGRYDRPDDPDVLDVVRRVQISFTPPGRPIGSARVTVVLRDGRVLHAEGESHAFPPSEWLPWMTDNNAGLLPDENLHRLVDLVTQLEEVEYLPDLLRCLTPGGAS